MAFGIQGVTVGTFEVPQSRTGCTVILPPEGTTGGVAVRGGAPGTREVAALGPNGTVSQCHGVVLCGSSLFGLAAADGVVEWCEARGRGLALAGGTFPIVGAAVVFDLRDPGMTRVDRAAGWQACANAAGDDPAMGPVGVGAGCTVGKEAGPDYAVAGGQGWAVRSHRGLMVAALMGVNAFGSVYGVDGALIAGCGAEPGVPRYPFTELAGLAAGGAGTIKSNTVIGCIVTNARLTKSEACRVADLGHTGIARSVDPVHTSLDGDTLFTLATGEVESHLDQVVYLAGHAVADAVRAAVDPARWGEG